MLAAADARHRAWASAPPSARPRTPPSRAPHACRQLLPALAALRSQGRRRHASTTAARRHRPRRRQPPRRPPGASTATPTPAPRPAELRPPPKTESRNRLQPRPPSSTAAPAKTTLPPVTNVWLIELSGPTFDERPRPAGRRALHRRPADPHGHAAERLVGARGQRLRERGRAARPARRRSVLDSIVQPPCPEGAAGAQCVARHTGRADGGRRIPEGDPAQITGTAAYREHGLIVVTFASVGLASASRTAGRRRPPRRSPPSLRGACC